MKIDINNVEGNAKINLSSELLNQYQTEQVFVIVEILYKLIRKWDIVKDELNKDEIVKINLETKPKLQNQLHIHMLHGIENLMFLSLGIIKKQKLWIWIKKAQQLELSKWAHSIIKENTQEKYGLSRKEIIEELFFKNVDKSFVNKNKKALKKIEIFFTEIAKLFVDKHEYNRFKHGMSLMSGKFKYQIVNDKNETRKTIEEINGWVYPIEVHKDKILFELKEINYEKDYEIARITFELTKLLVKTRIMKQSGNVKTIDFTNINTSDLFNRIINTITEKREY
jgi:hypothetical protein